MVEDRHIFLIEEELYLSNTILVNRFGFNATSLKSRNNDFANKRTDTYRFIKHPGDARINLTAFTSIPEATRSTKGMPTRDSLLNEYRNTQLSSLVAFNSNAYNYFMQQPETNKSAKEKAEQASWLIAIANAKTSQVRALGYSSKNEFYEAAITLMNQRGWHPWKCTTIKGMQKKLTPFQKYLKQKLTLAEACRSLISGKHGNDNAGKLEVDQHALLVQLYSDANAKPNFDQVWSIYTRKANEMVRMGLWHEKTLVNASTVRSYLTKPDVMQLWYEARHGHQAYRNVFEPVTQRFKPTYANALWVIDGTPLHRYFKTPEGGKYFRWNIFVVLDAFSQTVLGFWISEKENTDAVLGALRSACMVTGTLPTQVLYDNGRAIQSYRAQEALNKISVVAFPAKAGNARAKVIEGWFHWFNENVGKFRKGFTQNPFAKRLDNQPNREALALMAKNGELSMAEDIVRELKEDLTIANNKPRKFLGNKSPLAAYRASVQATPNKQRPFTAAIDVDAFYMLPGTNKKKKVFDEGKNKLVTFFEAQKYPFTNRGIDITINGTVYTYDIEDPNFRRLYIGQKFTVRYEPNPERWTNHQQPDELLLYKNDAPLQWNGDHARALVKELMPMAVGDYAPGTRALLNERLENKRTQRQLAQQDYSQLIERTKRNGTCIDMITANAFDKDVLNEARANRLDMITEGEEYNLAKPAKKIKAHPKDITPGPALDRLADYDEPDIIE